jgi:deoxyribonucleoside regulator
VARLVKVAQLYYEEGQSQQQIADRVGVSRASISRMLSEALDEGIVTITISRPFEHLEDLERELENAFALKRAIVVPTSIDDDATMDVVGRAAAELLGAVIRPGFTVGISWGRTMQHVVRAVKDPQVNGISVVQMLGSLGSGDPAIDGNELARRLAERLHAKYQFVNAPAIVQSRDDGERLRRVHSVQDALDSAESADIALFSLGTLRDPDTSLSRAGYLSEGERVGLLRDGGVGHVLAKVITRNGAEVMPFNGRVIAIDLASLKRMQWSVCVATFAEKAEVLLGLLTGGYSNTVVIDSALAEATLRLRAR